MDGGVPIKVWNGRGIGLAIEPHGFVLAIQLLQVDTGGRDKRRERGAVAGVALRELLVLHRGALPVLLGLEITGQLEPRCAGQLFPAGAAVLFVISPGHFQLPRLDVQPAERSQRLLVCSKILFPPVCLQQQVVRVEQVRLLLQNLLEFGDGRLRLILRDELAGFDDARVGGPTDLGLDSLVHLVFNARGAKCQRRPHAENEAADVRPVGYSAA